MAEYHLIVANPPHREPDISAVVPMLGCAATEARMRLNFPAPEILLVETDSNSARQNAQALVAAGVSVAWIPGAVLSAVPKCSVGLAVALEADGLVFATTAGEVRVEKNTRVVAVVGEPARQDEKRDSDNRSLLTQKVPGRGPVRNTPFVGGVAAGVAGSNTVDKLDKVAAEARDSAEKRLSGVQSLDASDLFVDVYAHTEAGWQVVRVSPSSTDFSGLGASKQPMARANINVIVDLLRERNDAKVDERLNKVTYKTSVVSGLALTQVLKSISEQLASISLMDIGSRLAFLTTKDRSG